MRDLFLTAVVLTGLAATVRYPFAGILLWTWFTCMDPHDSAWGFVQTAPINLIIACVTILAWLASKERKFVQLDFTHILIFSFLVWITFNGFFAVDPNYSWPLWNKVWKTIALGLFISVTATNKVRMHALVWVTVASLLYYSIKGGLFTILTGGANHVLGPPGSAIWDANQLAVATLMVLPLANYLRLHTANRWISRGLLAAIALSTVSIVGSYSRGAFIALGGLGGVALIRTKRKIFYVVSVALVIVPLFYFMPQSYFNRMNTIQTAQQDDSFHGRLVAWQVAWFYAKDHFPLGDGMSGGDLTQVFNHYFPDEKPRSAHSIFFQVLGDSGFLGLCLYLTILVVAFIYCSRIRRLTRGDPEFAWAFDLASMIQLSLFVFCLGGAALSMAYYDIPYICLGLVSAMMRMLKSIPSMNARLSSKFKPLAPTIAPAGFQTARDNGSTVQRFL